MSWIRTTVALAAIAATFAPGPTVGAVGSERYTRSVVEVQVPDVTLIDQHGDEVALKDLLQSGEPVLVDFIFATCTTICPVLSAGYSSLQHKLEGSGEAVRLVSVSIDPEHDGPAEMRAYLERYRARPGWRFLTGSRADVDRVMRAFDAYIPDKMSHRPLVFVRSPASDRWVRLEGFAGSGDLLDELQLARRPGAPGR